jgi:hypothetical protein
MATPVDKFNLELANLLRSATAEELVEILRDENSALRLMHNNINNTREAADAKVPERRDR